MTTRDDIEAVAGGVLRERWPAFPGEAFTASDGHRSIRMVTAEEVAAVLAEALAPMVAGVRAEALREAAAQIDRDHCVPPNVHQHPRSWQYRDGYFDGATHAAVVLRRAEAVAEQGGGEL